MPRLASSPGVVATQLRGSGFATLNTLPTILHEAPLSSHAQEGERATLLHVQEEGRGALSHVKEQGKGASSHVREEERGALSHGSHVQEEGRQAISAHVGTREQEGAAVSQVCWDSRHDCFRQLSHHAIRFGLTFGCFIPRWGICTGFQAGRGRPTGKARGHFCT